MISKIKFDTKSIETSTLLTKVIVGNRDSSVAGVIDELKNSDWVNEGIQYVHMDGESALCPFCQKKTVSKVLMEQIKHYFDKSYNLDKARL